MVPVWSLRYIRYYSLVKLQPSDIQCGFKRENLLIVCTNELISAINHPVVGRSPSAISNRDAYRPRGKHDRARTYANMRYCPS
jgi:hypothetical protein